ncbi:helix-turn-helix domain-containing protein [Cytophaga aurantiaca]|uniref:helix-turn-helix domain-containing protein n=1 Tax=Cytophaga aurantiaca TaxID=29530 RepID=UPI00036D239E|nr:helix-turn-helix domain-containing protein [Cytophaga aurantiaca]
MAVEIITKEDLKNFKTELLNELKELFSITSNQQKPWLKSQEVRKLLAISPGTLQHLRIIGTLPYTKIGGTLYYKHEDVIQMLEKNKKRK